jgi:hypothetical protein
VKLPWGKPAASAELALSDPAELTLETDTAPVIRRGILYLLIGFGGFMLWADRKSTRLNSSHNSESRMPSSA